MKQYQAVIFDYGNVLSLPQDEACVQQLVSMLGITEAEFEMYYWQLRVGYDRGDFAGEHYWNQIGKHCGTTFSAELIADFIRIDNMSWSRPNTQTVNWAKAIRRHGLKTAILSNMPIDFRRHLPALDWLPQFDHHTYSCEQRVNKPDAPIYEHCLQGLAGVDRSRVLFIDDREPNIEAARELGIDGLLFTTTEAVMSELQRLFDLPIQV